MGMALSVSCLVLVAIVAASASTSTLDSTSAAESTTLLGLSRSLHSPFGGAVKYGIKKPVGPQGLNLDGAFSSPLAKLAITAVEANNLDNKGLRGVSLKAQMKTVLARADEETKAEVAKVEEKVDAAAAQAAIQLRAKDLAGVSAPMGFFDPWGFSTKVSAGRLLFYREAELKHGRVCMLATLGIVVAERFHPLFGGNIDVPAYIAFQETPLQTFWVITLLAIGLLELPSIKTFNYPDPLQMWSLEDPNRIPGDFGFDPLGLKPKDPRLLKEMQNKELNNGRLAMIAAAGMIAQELVDGQKINIR
jgi:hypothetical protein